jgi:carboxymethylenebutenolidase
MRKRLVVASLLLVTLPALATTSKDVTYKSGDDTVHAILYTPGGKGPFPGIIVVHEWWGLNDWVKEQASKLADEGYAALAIDLYRGQVATTPDMAHELSRGVPDDRSDRDLQAAYEFLVAQPDVDKDKLGVIGWCMGGGYALDAALLEPNLKALVINYGSLVTDPEGLQKVHAAVLGIFGGQDRGISVSDVRKFEQRLKDQGRRVEIQVYPDAGHGFENPNNAAGYRATDAADAWSKTVTFLASVLKK